jgi:3-hydroxyisobutyrate dehydrogenase
MTNIAVLGLGIMGTGVAVNLLKAGHALAVWNRTASRAQPLAEQGARAAATPADAAQGAEIVFSVVGDDAASRAVWLGADGALAAMPPGAAVVECSTLSVGWVHELHQAAAARSLRFMDAPMGGSKAAAAGATLLLFVGAQPEVFESLRPVLAQMSSQQIHFGPPGAGALYKLINNMLGSIHVSALADALALAEKGGLPQDLVVQALTTGAASSPIVKNKIGRMVGRDYDEAEFATRWMHKDITYAVQAGEAHGLHLALALGAQERFGQALESGLADQDFAAVREVAGRPPAPPG